MRAVLIIVIAALPALAQNPVVKIVNTTRPGTEFQVGDHFEVVVTGAPGQPVSVRTTRHTLKTDWGPVIGSANASGQWSATGQFEKVDFGSWNEVWTVGGKAANPVLRFSVTAPCLPGGQTMVQVFGPNEVLTCDTASTKQQVFATPSTGDSWRTPDGRVISGNGDANMTAEQYQMEILQSMVMDRNMDLPGKLCAEAGDLIPKLTGVNALTGEETERVLSIVHAAYKQGPFRAPAQATPAMLTMLEMLGREAEQASLKQEIDETIRFVTAQ